MEQQDCTRPERGLGLGGNRHIDMSMQPFWLPFSARARSIAYPSQIISRKSNSLLLRSRSLAHLPSRPRVCYNCSRPVQQGYAVIGGSIPIANPEPYADINPAYTYSAWVLAQRQQEAVISPGFSFDHDYITPLAQNVEEYMRTKQDPLSQSQTPVELLEIPRLQQNVEVQEAIQWRWEKELKVLPWPSTVNYEAKTLHRKRRNIHTILNSFDQVEPPQHSVQALGTTDQVISKHTYSEDPISPLLDNSNNANKGGKPAVADPGNPTSAIEGFSCLEQDTPAEERLQTHILKSGMPELWDTHKPTAAPSLASNIWISRCFFLGLGQNIIGMYEYTKLILPRRAGTVGHIRTSDCDCCGTVVMYARYKDPEVHPEHFRVSAYLGYLENILVKPERCGISFIDLNPGIELTISNDLFQITDYYMENHATPHWAITHSDNWETIKKAILNGMFWCQPYFPLQLGIGMNRVCVYVQTIRYLLMCKVLLVTESVEFGGIKWEVERPELARGSMAEEFRYWAGLQLHLFKATTGYGNFVEFIPHMNNGAGGFGY